MNGILEIDSREYMQEMMKAKMEGREAKPIPPNLRLYYMITLNDRIAAE